MAGRSLDIRPLGSGTEATNRVLNQVRTVPISQGSLNNENDRHPVSAGEGHSRKPLKNNQLICPECKVRHFLSKKCK